MMTVKLTPLFVLSLLLTAAPALADDTPAPMPGAASELDFDATCTEAVVNKLDNTQSCLGFRRTMLGDGSVMFMMRIDGHTVSFVGKADPATTKVNQVITLEKAFIDDTPLLAAGTCTLGGDVKATSVLNCELVGVAQGHDFSFKVSFTSKGLLPLKASKAY